MDKYQLIQVLRNGSAPTEEMAQDVVDLKKIFPYSQFLHVIAAKISKDQRLAQNQNDLQEAAIYITDRSVLKEVMTESVKNESHASSSSEKKQGVELNAKTQEITVNRPDATNAVAESKPLADQNGKLSAEIVKAENKDASVISPTEDKIVSTPPASTMPTSAVDETQMVIDNVDFADLILKDLEKLSELKHNFEMLFVDQSIIDDQGDPAAANKATVDSKSKREKIIELAKAMTQPNVESPAPASKRRKKDMQPDIIEEIKISKEEIEPESDRQKEQIQIIDHFIKTQPTINSKDRATIPPADLNSIKSGEFGENIVSETLVEILVKQGKKERAIEVLKKLIWKYPQKKAYFASQIEDLKK